MQATYAYADMAGSSALAQLCYPEVTAKIIRAYIGTATRVLRGYGGEIRSLSHSAATGSTSSTAP